ncbi:hypothetical protein [Roseomonas chloroacetimidivorans]|uniref:hypothetical protein n=1 Tax=Roseomonas chloroacetimidivorans TaxID=1766656 RepID=UPI003C7464F3
MAIYAQTATEAVTLPQLDGSSQQYKKDEVINLVLWDGVTDITLEDGTELRLVPDGWGVVDGKLVELPAVTPAEPSIDSVPASITPRQARLALLQAGLLDEVDAAVAAAGRAAQLEWEYATIVERHGSMVVGLAASVPLTDQQLDDLFKAAAAL